VVFTIALLLGKFTQIEGFGWAAFFISVFYLLLALQYLFKQSWLRTVLKTFYISGVYLQALLLFLLLAIGLIMVLM
jgi:hypothetical protein